VFLANCLPGISVFPCPSDPAPAIQPSLPFIIVASDEAPCWPATASFSSRSGKIAVGRAGIALKGLGSERLRAYQADKFHDEYPFLLIEADIVIVRTAKKGGPR
jgi:hypothetical protein